MSFHKLLSSYFSVKACFTYTYTSHAASLNLKLGTFFFLEEFSHLFIFGKRKPTLCVFSEAEGGIRISICLIFLPLVLNYTFEADAGRRKPRVEFQGSFKGKLELPEQGREICTDARLRLRVLFH